MFTIHQAGFNFPFLSSFYYFEGIYGVIYSNATAKIGIKNCHHHCHQQRLQLKILPGQQVGNFCHQSIIQKSQLDKGKKKAHMCAHTENPPLEIKSMQRILEGLGRRGETSCSLGHFSALLSPGLAAVGTPAQHTWCDGAIH